MEGRMSDAVLAQQTARADCRGSVWIIFRLQHKKMYLSMPGSQ